MSETALQTLLDRAAIRDVLLRYARGIDRRDWDLVAACFTPGATADYGFVVRGTIEEAMPVIRTALTPFASTMHFMGNQVIELAGDTATSETYAVAYHRTDGTDESQLMSVGLRYLDELVRHEGAWRIRQRMVHFEWQRTDAATRPSAS